MLVKFFETDISEGFPGPVTPYLLTGGKHITRYQEIKTRREFAQSVYPSTNQGVRSVLKKWQDSAIVFLRNST